MQDFTRFLLPAIAALALAPATIAQTVHYPDDVLAQPPEFAFPLYTPGAGSAGDAVRLQLYCPDSFLSQQGLAASYVTSIGISVAGAAGYDEFVIRAGTTGQSSLGPDWASNLPDQRIQNDRSGTTLIGGGTPSNPTNQWVDFPLDFPFFYQPGDHLVVDLTTKLSIANVLCGTTIGNGMVERAYNFSYSAGAPATSFSSAGIKVRFTFAPLEMVPFGSGCAASGSTVPNLSAIGTPQIGQTVTLLVDQALPNTIGAFVFGFSRTEHAGAALPSDLGGGCSLLVAADVLSAAPVDATGLSGVPLPIPNDPLLRSAVLYTQFSHYDPASPASVPFVVSGAGILPIY